LAGRRRSEPGSGVRAAAEDAGVRRPGRLFRLPPGRAPRYAAVDGALAEPVLRAAGAAHEATALRPDGLPAAVVPAGPADRGDLRAGPTQRRPAGAGRRSAGVALRGRDLRPGRGR